MTLATMEYDGTNFFVVHPIPKDPIEGIVFRFNPTRDVCPFCAWAYSKTGASSKKDWKYVQREVYTDDAGESVAFYRHICPDCGNNICVATADTNFGVLFVEFKK